MTQAENAVIGEEEICGDMNPFAGTQVFADDRRSVLLFKIRKDREDGTDYLYEAQIRYILSQIQMEFPEYQGIGLFSGKEKE